MGTELTVIIVSRNGAERIGTAIRSVRNQGVAALQLIVVDDGSAPPLATLVPELHAPDIELHRIHPNRGAYHARNEGVKMARGRFIAFLDDDDEWLPGSLARRLSALQAAPDALMVHGSVLDCYPDGTSMVRLAVPTDHRTLLVRDTVATSSAIVRADALRKVGAFDDSLRRFGDWDTWIRLSAEGPILVDSAVGVHVQVRPGSLQHGAVDQTMAAREMILHRYRTQQHREGLLRRALAYHHAHFAARYYRTHRNPRARREALRSLRFRPNAKAMVVLGLSLVRTSDPETAYLRVKRALNGFRHRVPRLFPKSGPPSPGDSTR